MKIQNNLNTNQYSPRQKVKTQNSPSFSGARLPQQTFDNLAEWINRTGFVDKIMQIISPTNLRGEGLDSKVYKLNKNPWFLLRIPKKLPLGIIGNEQLKLLPDIFPNHNFGQVVATLGRNIQIVIKQKGTPNGIKNWLQLYRLLEFPKEKVPEFIFQLQKVSNVKQKAYNLLLKEVEFISYSERLFDFHNPQNILVYKTKAFNLVDIERKLSTKKYSKFIPSCVLHSLIDESNFLKAYTTANIEQRSEMQVYVEIIKSKIKKAAKKNYLSNNEHSFKNFLLDKYDSTDTYEKTRQILGDFSF